MSNVFVEDVNMQPIRFFPIFRAGSTRVTYKEFAIEFESLPIELQAQIKQIAFDRVSARNWNVKRNNMSRLTQRPPDIQAQALESKNPVAPRG